MAMVSTLRFLLLLALNSAHDIKIAELDLRNYR